MNIMILDINTILLYLNVPVTLPYWRTSVRSICPEVFCKKGVPKNFAKFTGKHLSEPFFNKVIK